MLRLISATFAVSATNALSARLLEKLESIKQLADNYDEDFNAELKRYMDVEISHEDVWNTDDNMLGDEDRPIEQQVVKMDLALYTKTFFGPEKSTVPWVVVAAPGPELFEKTGRNDGNQIVNLMRLLAVEFEGTCRFAYIDHWNLDERLHWQVMLGYFVHPNTYFFNPDGQGGFDIMEMWNFMYDRLSWFNMIKNELGLRGECIYMTWKAEPVPGFIMLMLGNQWRFQWDMYTDHFEQMIVQNIWRAWQINETQTFYEYYEMDKKYYDYVHYRTKVLHWIIAQVVIILSLLSMLWCCIRRCVCKKACCCSCCGGKKPQATSQVEQKDKKTQ